jgi:hypothetical protein
VGHLVGSILGTILAIFGTVALSACLIGGRAGGLALFALLSSVAGNALILTIFGMSTFATPAIGRVYLAGQQGVVEVNQDILSVPLVVTALYWINYLLFYKPGVGGEYCLCRGNVRLPKQ